MPIDEGGLTLWVGSIAAFTPLASSCMLYMFVSMEFGWNWSPVQVWMSIYGVVAAAMMLWMLVHFVLRRPRFS